MFPFLHINPHLLQCLYSIFLFSLSYFSICVIWQKDSIQKLLCRVRIALLLWGRVFHFLLKFVHMAPACPPAFWFLKSLKHSVSHGIADTSPCLHVWHRLATCHQGRHTQSQEVVSGGPRFSGVPVKKLYLSTFLNIPAQVEEESVLICLTEQVQISELQVLFSSTQFSPFSLHVAQPMECQVALTGIAVVPYELRPRGGSINTLKTI